MNGRLEETLQMEKKQRQGHEVCYHVRLSNDIVKPEQWSMKFNDLGGCLMDN
jgi:hypothetical protein